jgi:CBS-domain-containing membrane protein
VRSHDEPDVFRTTTVGQIVQPTAEGDAPARPTARTTDPLIVALAHLADSGLQVVPVVDAAGKLVGVCTRHDRLTARLALLDHERPEPGWLATRPRRAARTEPPGVVSR